MVVEVRDKKIEQGRGFLACETADRCARAWFWSGPCKSQGGLWRMSVERVRYGG
jgi:hypothetical protein